MKPTSRPSTKSSLLKNLSRLLELAYTGSGKLQISSPEKLQLDSLRVAILGIGQELCGDDAAGLIVVRRLQPAFAGYENRLLIETGPAPENFSGPVRRFKPNLVLLVDAAQMDALPGDVQVLPWQEASGFGASTHSLSLAMFAGYLEGELGCVIGLIGIQAAQNEFNTPLSFEVEDGVKRLVEAIKEKIEPENTSRA